MAENQIEIHDKLRTLLNEYLINYNCDSLDQLLMALEKKYKNWNLKTKMNAIIKKSDEGNGILPFTEYLKYI